MTSEVNLYKQKADNTKKELENLVRTGNTTYSNELKNNQRTSEMNEKNNLIQYRAFKTYSKAIKEQNLKNMLNEDKKYGDYDLKFMEIARKRYEDDFTENIIKLNYLDKELMTKDKIIMFAEDESNKKDNFIYILQSISFYLFLMLIPAILAKLNVIDKGLAIAIFVISGIITLIVVAVRAAKNRDVNIVKKTKDTAKQYAIPVIQKMVPKDFIKACPTNCKSKAVYSEEQMGPQYGNDVNEVWLDNSQDKWLDGDTPSVGGTKLGYQQLGEGAEPRPYYGGAPKTPRYECRWAGDPTKMTGMNKGLKFTTSIPCKFFPGYETVSKTEE